MKLCNSKTRSKLATLSIICNTIKTRPAIACWPRYHSLDHSRKRGWHASDVILIDDHVRIIHAWKMQMCVCVRARVCARERKGGERERRRGSGTMRSARPSFVDVPLDLAIDQTSRCKLNSFFLFLSEQSFAGTSSVFRDKKWNLRANQATVSIRHAAGYESSGNRNATLSYETSVWVSTVARGNNVGCCWWLNVWTTSKALYFYLFIFFFPLLRRIWGRFVGDRFDKRRKK